MTKHRLLEQPINVPVQHKFRAEKVIGEYYQKINLCNLPFNKWTLESYPYEPCHLNLAKTRDSLSVEPKCRKACDKCR